MAKEEERFIPQATEQLFIRDSAYKVEVDEAYKDGIGAVGVMGRVTDGSVFFLFCRKKKVVSALEAKILAWKRYSCSRLGRQTLFQIARSWCTESIARETWIGEWRVLSSLCSTNLTKGRERLCGPRERIKGC
uniref:Uncharacterized protein n=1 Tax=Cannabis sativa TaxID=3483 RepID=A0A803Q914_CANSA